MCLELKFCVVCSPYFKYYKHSVVEAESSQNNLAAFLERFFTCKNFSLYITRRHFLLYSPSNPTTHIVSNTTNFIYSFLTLTLVSHGLQITLCPRADERKKLFPKLPSQNIIKTTTDNWSSAKICN